MERTVDILKREWVLNECEEDQATLAAEDTTNALRRRSTSAVIEAWKKAYNKSEVAGCTNAGREKSRGRSLKALFFLVT